MKNILSALSTLVVTATLAMSGSVEADTSFQIGVGYRSDDIHWNTKLPCTERPNTFSKLQFKDLEIVTIEARLKGGCGDCLYYRADFEYGWILDGNVHERDQFAIPPTGVVVDGTPITVVNTTTHNDVKGKYVADFSLALGYPWEQCWCSGLQIVPVIGFAYDTQRIRGNNHETVIEEISEVDPALPGELDLVGNGGRHAKFRTTWWGPFIGVDFAFCHRDCWNLYGEIAYHFTRARRERNSNTGLEDFDRHERSRHGYGWNIKLGSIYYFRCNWFIDGHLTYKRFYSDEHRDHLLWRSVGVGVALGYTF